MNWDLGCGNASELARQADVLEQTSVIHFSFSMTIMLTILFMIIYSQMSSNKSIIQFILVSSFVFYVLNVIIKLHSGGYNKQEVQMNQKQDFSDVQNVIIHGVNMINYFNHIIK